MRIERDLVIQGVPWKVRTAEILSVIDDCYGWTDFDTCTIWISSNVSMEEQTDALFHEITHVLTRGLESCDLAKSEDCVRTFSTAWVDTILRNQLTFGREEGGW